jgi:catechol-2,3-dioxygenase
MNRLIRAGRKTVSAEMTTSQGTTDTSAQLAPELIDGVCELTLEARDLGRLEAFYSDALGMRTIKREDDRIWLAAGVRTRLGIWSPGRKEFDDRGGRHVHFALSASPGGLDRVVERLRSLEIEFRGPVEHPGGDRSVYFEDPEENVVEVWDFFERDEGSREGVDALA